MPKHVRLTEDDVQWLTDNHRRFSYEHQAKHIGCCVDTLKRILVRLDLQEFHGAKYTKARKRLQEMWRRPCVRCGSTIERPKNHYMCPDCRHDLGYQKDDY